MNQKVLNLKGIFPPIPTSFDKNGDLDPGKVRNNVEFYNRFDLAGYVVLGSNGEFVLLDEAEKVTLIKTIRECMPAHKPLLAGVGCESTQATIRLCHSAAISGANAALVITPAFYKGKMSEPALQKFFTDVADASPIPVILYNMPANTGIDISANLVVSLANHSNIIGLKDSGGNITKMGEIVHNVSDDFQVLAGSAGFLLPALIMGAVGGIVALADIAPAQCLLIQQLFSEGKLKEAKSLQSSLISLNQLITKVGGVPVLKSAMDYLGLYGGPVRGPLLPATAEEALKVQKSLKESGIDKITDLNVIDRELESAIK